jgi:HEAT repeat protein
VRATLAPTPIRAPVQSRTLATPAPAPAARRGQSPAELEALYFSSKPSLAERGEIIRALGELATPAAGQVLGRIFEREKRQDLKMDAFAAAYELPDDTCREQKFAVLQQAVSPAMSEIVRIGAVQALAEFDDPRVTQALRALTKDANRNVREQALELLAERADAPR